MPPFWLHGVSAGIYEMPQLFAVHTLVAHWLPVTGQSADITHATQDPVPLHFMPPFWLHSVSAGIYEMPQLFAVHTLVAHWLLVTGQSAAITHATQDPVPLHIMPPFWLHGVSAGIYEMPQLFAVHTLVAHWLPVTGQSAAITHATQDPVPLQIMPPF
jgi:hypothetical protein